MRLIVKGVFILLLGSGFVYGQQEALKLYEAGDFKGAQTRLQQLFAADMGNAQINFYLGRCAFELKEYDRAIAAFERVLIAQPNNLRARLELGRTYFATNMHEEAEAEFRKVLENPLPAQVRDNVLRYLVQIEESRKNHFFSGSVGVGAAHDTNVKNGSDYEMNIFGDEVNINPKEDSAAWQLFGGFSHRYDPKNDKMQWQSNAQFFMQRYTDVDDVDVRFISLSTGPLFNGGAWAWSVPLSVDHLNYGGENYLLSPGIGVRGDQTLSAGSMITYEYKLQDRQNQIDANEERDVTAQSLGVNYQRMIREGRGVLSAGGTLALSRKKTGDLKDVSNDALILKAGYFARLSKALSLNLNGSLKQVRYPDEPLKISGGGNEERKDNAASMGASLSWQLAERFFAQGSLTYLNNASSDDYYDYDKQVYALSLLRTF